MTTLPDDVFESAVRTFFARHYGPDRDLDHLLMVLEGALYVDDLRDALGVAYAAGQRSREVTA